MFVRLFCVQSECVGSFEVKLNGDCIDSVLDWEIISIDCVALCCLGQVPGSHYVEVAGAVRFLFRLSLDCVLTFFF